MKCVGIRIGGVNPDKRTLKQFVGSAEAGSPLGKLLIALTQETAWSGKYTVSASFYEEPHLCIGHKTFLSEELNINIETDAEWSVRRVEDSVRKHLLDLQKSIRLAAKILQGKVNNMQQALDDIPANKAKAAVVATFPEATDIGQFSSGRDDLCAFYKNDVDRSPIYIAREIDHEFVGGVARVDCNAIYWHGLQNGIANNDRHKLFWTQLARAYAACRLGIPEKDLSFESIFVVKNPPTSLRVDPYVVDKVVLRTRGEKDDIVIVVLFGDNNLPRSVSPESSEQTIT